MMIYLLFCDLFTTSFERFIGYDFTCEPKEVNIAVYKEDLFMLAVQIVLFDGFDLLDAIAP